MHRSAILLALAAAALAAPAAARAQGDDAPPPGRGELRLLLPPVWSHWDRRFGQGTAGLPTGALEPSGTDFDADSLGATQLPFLVPSQSTLRSVTGIPDFAFNLGRTRLDLSTNVRAQPLGLAVGLSRRLSVSVVVPLVRSRVEVFFTKDSAAARRANVGWNPAYEAPGSADAFRGQVDSALAALRTQAVSGPAALRAQAQAALDAMAPLLCGLYALAGGSSTDPTSACYAASAVGAAAFLPLAATAAGDSITGRLAAAQSGYAALASDYAAAGVALPALTAGMDLPDSAVTRDDIQRFLMDPAVGAGGDSLAMALRTRLGDIEAAATYVIADGPRYRGRVTTTIRLPTGMVGSDRNFVEVGTGDHQTDVEVAVRNDVALGTSLRIVAAGRVGVQLADELWRRVSPPNLPIAPLAQRALVRRDLGDYVGVDLTPTWLLDDALSLGVRYSFFRQGPTRFTYADPADSARVGVAAGVLDAETSVRWMRAGATLTFSTLGRHAAGRARLPYTVSIGWQSTLWGRGGRTPQTSLVFITLATYFRLWGG